MIDGQTSNRNLSVLLAANCVQVAGSKITTDLILAQPLLDLYSVELPEVTQDLEMENIIISSQHQP